MCKSIERRNSKTFEPIIGDRNRLRRKDDSLLREKLLSTIVRKSQDTLYLTPTSRKQVEVELTRGYIRAIIEDDEIMAYVRCLPLSNDASFIMTLHGKMKKHVLELLDRLAPDGTILLETVKRHMCDLDISEYDLAAVGFESANRGDLSLAHLVRTNWHYFKSDPLRFVKGFFQLESSNDEYVIFVRQKDNHRHRS